MPTTATTSKSTLRCRRHNATHPADQQRRSQLRSSNLMLQATRSRPLKTMTDNSNRLPTTPKPLFGLGQVVATLGALSAMTELDIAPLDLIHRHVTGDWGDLGSEDQQQNLLAIRSGLRIFSSYEISASVKIWSITEADRSSTTLLLPDEY